MVCLREKNLAAGSGGMGEMSMGDIFLELFDRSVSAGWMILAVVQGGVSRNAKMGKVCAVGMRCYPSGLSVFH